MILKMPSFGRSCVVMNFLYFLSLMKWHHTRLVDCHKCHSTIDSKSKQHPSILSNSHHYNNSLTVLLNVSVKDRLNRSFNSLLELLKGLGKDETALAEKANKRLILIKFCWHLRISVWHRSWIGCFNGSAAHGINETCVEQARVFVTSKHLNLGGWKPTKLTSTNICI